MRLARSIRALRRRRGWRQADLARAAGVSQSAVSRAELGSAGGLSLRSLERLVVALGASLFVEIHWHGERLDRLLDQDHAGLVEDVLRRLRRAGWIAAPEVSFSIYGERGSIDILALHPTSRACLVVEVKSVVPDVQAMLAALDRKRRLARRIAGERDWEVATVSRLLVVADGRTARRRVEAHEETFAVAFPVRGADLRRWLRDPQASSVSGLWFLPPTHGASGRQGREGRRRVRAAIPRSVGGSTRAPPPSEHARHSPHG
jgi:transcriptional regulator with XRE-family HTH domain